MARISFFENISNINTAATGRILGNGTLHIQGVYIPGSISLNTLAMILSASGTTAKTLSLSFGLYSLNGGTLSLANSASFSTNPAANTFAWISLNTSANQDITPGNWYLAIMSSTSSGSHLSLLIHNAGAGSNTNFVQGGLFVRGIMTVSTNAMPVSIATSDCEKETRSFTTDKHNFPYILIAA